MSLTDPPDLDPATKEIWAGFRRPSSRSSELQQEFNDLRARLSGFVAYQQFLRDQNSFGELESSLTQRADDVGSLSAEDIERTRSFLENLFSTWSGYKGDPSSDTGVYSRSSYDEYRAYLVSDNNADEIDADEHIQTIQTIYDADERAASATGTHTDWADAESDLINRGISSADAASAVSNLQEVFVSVRRFNQQVLISSSWGEFETFLADNGLDSSPASSTVSTLKSAYGNTLDAGTRDLLSQFDSLDDWEDWLVSTGGFERTDATRIRDTIEGEGLTIDDVRQITITDGLAGLLNNLEHGNTTGTAQAGLKIWKEEGTTLSGKTAKKNAISVRGREIYFEPTQQPEDESSGSNPDTSSDPILWSNLKLEKSEIPIDSSIRISARASAKQSGLAKKVATATLQIDGEVVATKSRTIDAGDTETFSFRRSFGSFGDYEIAISDTATKTLSVVLPGL